MFRGLDALCCAVLCLWYTHATAVALRAAGGCVFFVMGRRNRCKITCTVCEPVKNLFVLARPQLSCTAGCVVQYFQYTISNVLLCLKLEPEIHKCEMLKCCRLSYCAKGTRYKGSASLAQGRTQLKHVKGAERRGP